MVFLASALALLFNRWVRLSSFVLGSTILVGIAASRVYWANNTFFFGSVLFLTGLQQRGRSPWLLRVQVAMIYFGAGLNKLLDPDWQSGQFFEYWTRANLQHELYIQIASLFPPMALSWLMSWATIVTEFALFIGFSLRRLWPLAIWLSILFHAAMTLFTGLTFVLFFYVALASYFVFVNWPDSRLLVFYDGDCGFCAKTKKLFDRLDFEGRFDWKPYQNGESTRHGLSPQALQQKLHVIGLSKTHRGFAAFKILLLYNPLTYFVIATMLLAVHDGPADLRNFMIVALLLFFSPLFRPIGEAAYARVARNRARLPSDSRCNVD